MNKTAPWYVLSDSGVLLTIKVSPAAKLCRILSCSEEAPWIKIAVSSPPEKGKANQMVLSFLSKTLEIPLSELHLLSGSASQHKKVSVSKKISYQSILALLNKERECP